MLAGLGEIVILSEAKNPRISLEAHQQSEWLVAKKSSF